MARFKIFEPLVFLIQISSALVLVTSMRLQDTLRDGAQDLVSTSCNHTLYSEVCESALRSDPRSQASDLLGLADIALNISIAHGTETVARINDLKSRSNSNDTQLSDILNECMEEYGDATENLQEAIHALRIRSFDDVDTLVSSAMTDSDTCEQAFQEMNRASLLTERNQLFSKLCSIFLSLAHLLR